jgi:hypothetical protein
MWVALTSIKAWNATVDYANKSKTVKNGGLRHACIWD